MAAISSPKTVPMHTGTPLIGSMFEVGADGLLNFAYKLWQEYGDIVGYKLGPMTFIQIVQPEHVQEVMVKETDVFIKGASLDRFREAIGNGIFNLEGERWRSRRRLMAPTYTPHGIQGFAEIMTDASRELVTRWQNFPSDHVFDINDEMTQVTLKVISHAMFGMSVPDDPIVFGNDLRTLLEYTDHNTQAIINLPLSVPTPRNQRIKAAKADVRDFIFKVINKRREDGPQDDLLSMLITAVDEETGQELDDDELHDEVLINYFAGHETTASLLTWAFFLLSKYPEVEAKLHHELEAVLNGRTPTLEDIKNLPYTDMVLKEALRLYSPVSMTIRDAARDTEIDGYPIPKGTIVAILPYVTHRLSNLWEHPMAFYPEHFTPEAEAARQRYAYYPFGAGPRICIGIHFAQMEAILVLAEIAQRFRVRLAKVNDGAVDFVGVIRPAQPIMVNLEAR